MKNLFVLIILISVFSPAVKAQIQVSGPSSIECGESAIYAVNVLPDYCICDLSVSIVGGVFCGTNSSQQLILPSYGPNSRDCSQEYSGLTTFSVCWETEGI